MVLFFLKRLVLPGQGGVDGFDVGFKIGALALYLGHFGEDVLVFGCQVLAGRRKGGGFVLQAGHVLVQVGQIVFGAVDCCAGCRTGWIFWAAISWFFCQRASLMASTAASNFLSWELCPMSVSLSCSIRAASASISRLMRS